MMVVVQSRRPTAIVDVVVDLFSIEMRDLGDRLYHRVASFDLGRIEARGVFDIEHRFEPAGGADYVQEVKLLGRLLGRDAESGEELDEPIAFWCDGDSDVYLHPASSELATGHPSWSAAIDKPKPPSN